METIQDATEAFSSSAAKLQDNKAIAILDAAAAGKYGVPAVVVVSLLVLRIHSPSPISLTKY